MTNTNYSYLLDKLCKRLVADSLLVDGRSVWKQEGGESIMVYETYTDFLHEVFRSGELDLDHRYFGWMMRALKERRSPRIKMIFS